MPVYDLGRDEDGLYFTMKRVHGHTLSRVIQGLAEDDPAYVSRFTQRRLLAAFHQVCQAVHYAHTRGVLHRDLKPSNVMLGELGEVYVLDWGLARIVDEAPLSQAEKEIPREALFDGDALSKVRPEAPDLSRVTSADVVIGTLAYMPPNQFLGPDVDARADVYSLGIVLYEILTLSRYRLRATIQSLVGEIADRRVARPSDVVPDVDPELDEACVRATQIAPSDRFRSAKELADAVERVLDGARDAEARAVAAERHLERAQKLLESEAKDEDRVSAMHELLRAVTLDSNADEARSLLVELVSRGDGPVPKGAESEIEKASLAQRLAGLDGTMLGLASWLLPVPIVVMTLGVRSWPYFWFTAGSTLAAMALAAVARLRRTVSSGVAFGLAALLGTILVSASFILGPFAVVPTMAATCSMFFAMHVRPRERAVVAAILALAALLPFALDATGLVPPGFSVQDGRIVLYPRMLDLPALPTVVGLAWVSGSFTIFSALITGRMRDRLEEAERRNIVSAWHLHQLFRAAGESEKSATA